MLQAYPLIYIVQTSLELFLNIGYDCTIPKGVEWNRIVLRLHYQYYAMILLVEMKWVIILPKKQTQW